MEGDISFRSLSSPYFLANQLIDLIKSEQLSSVIDFVDRQRVNWNVVLPEYGGAPIHYLAGKENERFAVAVLKRALKDGGDPNTRMEDGLTPVHLAAMWGRCRVLEVLLTHGGDPQLVDWTLYLNAEEYALKEQQYQAYAVLTTYSVIVDDVERFEKYLSNESSPNPSPREEPDVTSSLNSKPEKVVDGALYENNDGLATSSEHIPVSGKAVDMIQEHRRRTRLYEHPKGKTYRECWENVLSELPKIKTKESVYESLHEQYDGVSGGHKDLVLTDKSRTSHHAIKQPVYEEVRDACDIDQSKSKARKKTSKHRSFPKCTEESEVYLQGFEEVSYKTVDRRRQHGRPGAGSSASTTSRADDSQRRRPQPCPLQNVQDLPLHAEEEKNLPAHQSLNQLKNQL